MNSSPVAPPLRVLSLDGGGIRGKSSLLILENIMETIRQAKGLESVPRPCEHFDLIGGTSTGGIIAIMLGRLGMTVDQCIQAYDRVAQTAFTPKRTSIIPGSPKGAYSAQALEGAIKQTIKEFCVESPCIDQRRQGRSTVDSCPHENAGFRSTSCTKTAVLAITKDNVDASPTLFTTYDTATNLSYRDCAIWQVARATSAATTFFKSIKVGRDNVEFIDAGFGCNNPCKVLIKEARRQFPKHDGLRVLSIGTGLGGVVAIRDSRRAILNALAKMASSSTEVAKELHNQYGNGGQYYRFNVERGLEDITLSEWEKTSTISAHTGNYLKDNQEAIQKFVDSFINCPGIQAEATELQGATTSSSVPHYISLPRNEHFVGRTETLELLNRKLFAGGGHRRVCLYGLGGVGKTQVALRIAYEAKDIRGIVVLWLPAASNAAFQQACTKAAERLAIEAAKDADPKQLLQQYLNSGKAGKWLLIIDNIDEIDTLLGSPSQPGIGFFLPDSENGCILFTTRPYDVALRVADDHDIVELKEMSHVDAKRYLGEKLQLDQIEDDTAATELLNQLAHLPLAITQAAAYMRRNKKSVREYLDLLRRTESDATDLISWEFYDRNRYEESQNAVALTWHVSFKQIREINTTAAELLRFISRIEPKSIPRSMLPKEGSEIRLDDAIGTLLGYAFLDVREDGETYDMHSLVHLATRTWVKTQGFEEKLMADLTEHLYDVFPNHEWENRHVWRQYLPHALRVLHEDEWRSEKSIDLSISVGRCLLGEAQYDDAIRILQGVVSARKETLGEDDPRRLESVYELATAYHAGGQVPEAIKLLEHVVEIQKTTLAEDHPSRLSSQHALAMAYTNHYGGGQLLKAVELLEHVVEIQKTTLAEDHPNQLNSQNALATAYVMQGGDNRVLQAIEILEHVVQVQKTFAEDHPSRLRSEHELAAAYIRQGGENLPKAVELLERVLEAQPVEDTPNRLASEYALARAYINQGGEQVSKAVKLLEHVVEKTTLTYDLIPSEYWLGLAYLEQGGEQIPKAVKVLEHVVEMEKVTLAEDDPSRLISKYWLGRAYLEQGGEQVPKAVKVLEHVVETWKVSLAEDDLSRLRSERALGIAYYTNGQVREGIECLEHVASIQRANSAEDDSQRLITERALERARNNCIMTTFESWFDDINSV
ncbi:acyl transferase/acyl hydrolase/lysophospholipase [Xylaria curta]|nr:acyl transferase/acyl hydrolase/lysophospholipase [Xylaria curta]